MTYNDARADASTASTASEALRGLAHATGHTDDLDPVEVYDVLGALANTAGHSRALRQLARWHRGNAERATSQPGRDDALAAAEHLETAAAHADQARAAVDTAFNLNGRITWHPPGPGRRAAPRLQPGPPDHGHSL